MDRRRFLGLAATGAAALGVSGCEQAGFMPPLQPAR